ncbi:MAG: hypothetical protein M1818_001043 [Claussenomyces sp. TS43310]|nr:MAG: hypothetical protein M1818_001043 [Claussenomyces sp. TS43310]
MAQQYFTDTPEAENRHTRTKSSVLRSFILRRTPSRGTGLHSEATTELSLDSFSKADQSSVPNLDDDGLRSRALGEIPNHQDYPASPPKTSRDDGNAMTTNSGNKSLHKKTLSTISLKSLADKDGDRQSKQKEDKLGKPKKTKSSTNLATLLSRSKSSKNLHKAAQEELQASKDKENRTPPHSSPADPFSRPPIYAQFSSQQFTTQPLGGKFLEHEMDLYSPQQYFPDNQRDKYEVEGLQPALNRPENSRRPFSTYLQSGVSLQEISQRNEPRRQSSEQLRPVSDGVHQPDLKTTVPETKNESGTEQNNARTTKAYGSRSKVHRPESKTKEEIKDVATEFEAMLDRRNIPENQRHKMRSIAASIKIDMIRQDWAETAAAAASASQTDRPGTNSSVETAGNPADGQIKPKRPRSRTFTLSRSSKDLTSPSKKTKSEVTFGRHSRTDSAGSDGKTSTASKAAVASALFAKAKGQLPDDFVSYLRKVPKPEFVEVGKLHKLRLLLRNETVAWTDNFIGLGGMKEIVGLLHRTLDVEWRLVVFHSLPTLPSLYALMINGVISREEHEDALLHEVLLCLKALCTTALALEHLDQIQTTLFPALIHMLFDEQKKGPSEFTTRNIVTSLLFTYLKSADASERPQRARALLSHLRDPEPKEEERPVPFVLEMRRERPYRIWNKEVVNVTKEVFWIFLHNLNVIALPPTGSSSTSSWAGAESCNSLTSSASDVNANCTHSRGYMIKHFPQELPPVAAAPYVGGVEWDATNYLTSHLDLINGILASLESAAERNLLREQLLVSGWERCMGGTLRLCKEKFYGGVHAALRCWVAAGLDDAWDVADVRCGPRSEPRSPVRRSPKKKADEAPQIDMPRLDFELPAQKRDESRSDSAWL